MELEQPTSTPVKQHNTPTRLLKALGGLVIVGVMASVATLALVQLEPLDSIRAPSEIGSASYPIAIVLGASVKQDGTPSDALMDRIVTGVNLYKAGKVQKLLMTGDDGAVHIDEVGAMKRTAIELGMPAEDVLTDGHGYRTYESCKRAATLYGVDKAFIITQRFHLARSIFLCKHLGVEESIGVVADRQPYRDIVFFMTREAFASVKAGIDIYIHAPKAPGEG